MPKKKECTNCETCVNYVYDDDAEEYTCMVELDEDEFVKYMESAYDSCPFYHLYDEYKTVRKQN